MNDEQKRQLKYAQLLKALGRMYAREQRKYTCNRDYALMMAIEQALWAIDDDTSIDLPVYDHFMRGFHSILPYVN